MALGSNNPFPSVLVVEQGSTPATPAAGRQRLFIDSADGHLKRVDDAAAVTDIEDGAGGDVVGPASAVDERVAVFDGTTGKLLKDGGQTIASIVAGVPIAPDYLQYRDEQAQNTAGGTFTSGAWQTRVLNTEVSDTGSHGSLSSNQITLDAGTYEVRALAPAFNCGRHQLRLQNTTDAATLLTGPSCASASSGTQDENHAFLMGRFTIGASKALELQHRCEGTQATNGFGIEANFGTEVYATIELWKVG